MKYPIIIEQTQNKHSRALFKNNQVIIRLAKRLTEKQKRLHIEQLTSGIQKKILHKRARTAIKPFSIIHTNQTAYIPLTNDAVFTVTIHKSTSQRLRIQGAYSVNGTYTDDSKSRLPRKLWQLLSTCSHNYFSSEVEKLNRSTYKVEVKKMTIGYKSSAWGSMSTNGHLRLNPALLFVPKHLRDYVIIHELAHVLEPNHSKQFWQHVERFIPEYNQYRKELQGFELPKL